MFVQKPVAALIVFVGLSWFESKTLAAPAPQTDAPAGPSSQHGPYGGVNPQTGPYPGTNMQPTGSYGGPYMQPMSSYMPQSGPYPGPYMPQYSPYSYAPYPNGPYMPYGNPQPEAEEEESPSYGSKIEATHKFSLGNPQFLNGVKVKLGK